MKKTNFWREFELVAVVVFCPYCDDEIKYCTYEAKKIFGDLWYSQAAEIECPECGEVFFVEHGEDNI